LYDMRGVTLRDISLLEFASTLVVRRRRKQGDETTTTEEAAHEGSCPRRGRPKNATHRFLSTSPLYDDFEIVVLSRFGVPNLFKPPAWPMAPPEGEEFSRRWYAAANRFASFALAVYLPWPAPGSPGRFSSNGRQPYLNLLDMLERMLAPLSEDTHEDEEAVATHFADHAAAEMIYMLMMGHRVPADARAAVSRLRNCAAQRWDVRDPRRELYDAARQARMDANCGVDSAGARDEDGDSDEDGEVDAKSKKEFEKRKALLDISAAAASLAAGDAAEAAAARQAELQRQTERVVGSICNALVACLPAGGVLPSAAGEGIGAAAAAAAAAQVPRGWPCVLPHGDAESVAANISKDPVFAVREPVPVPAQGPSPSPSGSPSPARGPAAAGAATGRDMGEEVGVGGDGLNSSGAARPVGVAEAKLAEIMAGKTPPNNGQHRVLLELAKYLDKCHRDGRENAGEAPHIFLQGAGGTGKSFLFHALDQLAAAVGTTTLATALTGVACGNIRTGNGARTVHSAIGCGYDLKVKKQSDEKATRTSLEFLACGVIIVDEVSFATPQHLAALDERARLALSNDLPFGGLPVVLAGDMHQLPAVGETIYSEVTTFA
jgi:hypothetical protein